MGCSCDEPGLGDSINDVVLVVVKVQVEHVVNGRGESHQSHLDESEYFCL